MNQNQMDGTRTLGSGGQGRLKLFIGAAPGVGKTFTMLREASGLKERGVDVVIGYIDAHGRQETLAQLRGLEVMPRRKIVFQDRAFEEVDVDGILARQPEAAVIDELAHSNVPGSDRPKRYMDVECLLDHGIDILTAVNIQHLEPVYREAEQITGVPVREVIPASFLRRADEVEVIDVTPETLRRRLRDGVIYPPDKVEQALNHFFRKSNLSALRELALRQVAEDVDQRLQESYDRRRIPGPVGARENVLACVNYVHRAEKLIVKAARMALRVKADLIVLTITNMPEGEWSAAERDRVRALEALAEKFHARFVVEAKNDRPIGAIIMEVAERYNVTQVVIGQPKRNRRFAQILSRSPTEYLLKHLRYIDLRIVGWRD